MVEPPPDPKLLRLVMERDQEREQRIRYQRAAQAWKNKAAQLQRRVQTLTRDHAAAVNRASRAEARKPPRT
jgi:hypothetical protein